MRVNCDAGDTFDQLWIKVADEFEIAATELPEPLRGRLQGRSSKANGFSLAAY